VPRPTTLVILGLLSYMVGLAIGIKGNAIDLSVLPGLGSAADLFATSAAAPGLLGIAAALLVFLVGGFFVPAAADSMSLASLAGRLQSLRAEPTAEALRSAFRKGPLLVEGRRYAEGLWQGRAPASGTNPAWRSSLDPATLFARARQGREAAGAFFFQVGLALSAIGILAFVWIGGINVAGSSASIALAGVAIALLLGIRFLTHIRVQQVSDIAASMAALFPTAEAEYLVDRMAGVVGEDSAVRALAIEAASRTVTDGLATTIQDLKNTLATHDRRIAASVASAVQRVVQPITTHVQDMLQRMETESSAKGEQLLQAVLTEFLAGFQQRFATQTSEIGGLMAETKTLAEALRGSFAESEAVREELSRTMVGAMAQAVEAAVEQQTAAMRAIVENVDAAVSRTGAGIERLGDRTDSAMAKWTQQTEEIAISVVAHSAEEMKRTAAAFNQLHDILETLSLSVLPSINKLVRTQERLHDTIDTNQSSAQSVSAAANDLGEAAKIAREMVERQILFTRELAQLTRGGASAAASRPGGSPPPSADADLVRAIGDLRALADDDMKSLPSL
jgi:hypothetical protein